MVCDPARRARLWVVKSGRGRRTALCVVRCSRRQALEMARGYAGADAAATCHPAGPGQRMADIAAPAPGGAWRRIARACGRVPWPAALGSLGRAAGIWWAAEV